MCFPVYNPLHLIVEISELFQEILKIAAVDGIITSWCLEVRLENVETDISTDQQAEHLRCLHALGSFILKLLAKEKHDVSSNSCNCGWDLSQMPEFQHHDIDRYTPGTIIRWSQGECHVLLAPLEALPYHSPNGDEGGSQSEEETVQQSESPSGVICCTEDEDNDETADQSFAPVSFENDKPNIFPLEKEEVNDDSTESSTCLLDISQNQGEEIKNVVNSVIHLKKEDDFETVQSSTSDDEDNSCMLVINEDGLDEECNKADNETGLDVSSHMKPLTNSNVLTHALQENIVLGKLDETAEELNCSEDEDDTSSVSSTSSSTSSSSSSSSSSDDDDRINFEKRIEQAAQAAKKAAASALAIEENQNALNSKIVISKSIDSDIETSLQLNDNAEGSEEISELSKENVVLPKSFQKIPAKRHPDDIQAAQVLFTMGKSQDSHNNGNTNSQLKLESSLAPNQNSKKLIENKSFQVRRLGNQSFQCGLCGKIYSRMVKVLEHYLSHTGEKPWHCGNCEKKFKKSYSLEKHNRVKHSTNQLQQFTCKICLKNFGVRSALQTHLAIHSLTKPFMCSICGRTFALKFTRDSHEFQHTGKRPWSCSICNKSYITKYKLKAHMKAHTGELICDICGSNVFGSQDALTRHRKRHSKETESNLVKLNKKLKTSARGSKLEFPVMKTVHQIGLASKNVAYGNSSVSDGTTSEFRCQMCNQVFLKSTCLTHHLASCNALTYCPPSSGQAIATQSPPQPSSQQHVIVQAGINQEQSSSSLTSSQQLEKDNLFPLYELSVSESIVAGLDNRSFALDPISNVSSSNAFQQSETLLETSSETVTKVLPDFLNDVAFGNPT